MICYITVDKVMDPETGEFLFDVAQVHSRGLTLVATVLGNSPDYTIRMELNHCDKCNCDICCGYKDCEHKPRFHEVEGTCKITKDSVRHILSCDKELMFDGIGEKRTQHCHQFIAYEPADDLMKKNRKVYKVEIPGQHFGEMELKFSLDSVLSGLFSNAKNAIAKMFFSQKEKKPKQLGKKPGNTKVLSIE